MSASIAPAGVVRIAPVIPKHTSLCTLLSFLVLAVWQPCHHTKDAKEMVGRMMATLSQWIILVSDPTPPRTPSYRPITYYEPSSP